MHGHHSHETGDAGPRLLAAILLNLLIPLGQTVAGVIAGSLGLLSDAVHNLSDVIALSLAYVAERFGRRPPTARRTYALKRGEILAAFVNASALIAISLFVAVEGVRRLLSPRPVDGLIVMIAAGAGLVVNAVSALLLRRAEGNLNLRAAFLHLLGDTFASLAVLLGGACVFMFSWYWVDPALSLIIAAWMGYEAGKIVRDTLEVLMEGVPWNIDPALVERTITTVPGVRGVHDLHLWAISSSDLVMSAHVEVETESFAAVEPVLRAVKNAVQEKHGIGHATLEPEIAGGICAGGVCAPGPSGPGNATSTQPGGA